MTGAENKLKLETETDTGFIGRLRRQINRGESLLTYDLTNLLPGRGVDEEDLEALEEALLLADAGVDATTEILDFMRDEMHHGRVQDVRSFQTALRTALVRLLAPRAEPLEIPEATTRPFVILMVGVNGSGKTTTTGKLAQRFSKQGRSVLLGAADTFRAAAIEQLQQVGEKTGVPVIAQSAGADPAAVAFDAAEAAAARGTDVLLVDSAGRLHTQGHLMDELAKVRRVLSRRDETAPHETLLVLDATNGQNALVQARQFSEAVGVTGLVITKLDGTARGGIVLALARELALPIRYIGVGEQPEDLGVFDAEAFVDALLPDPEQRS